MTLCVCGSLIGHLRSAIDNLCKALLADATKAPPTVDRLNLVCVNIHHLLCRMRVVEGVDNVVQALEADVKRKRALVQRLQAAVGDAQQIAGVHAGFDAGAGAGAGATVAGAGAGAGAAAGAGAGVGGDAAAEAVSVVGGSNVAHRTAAEGSVRANGVVAPGAASSVAPPHPVSRPPPAPAQ